MYQLVIGVNGWENVINSNKVQENTGNATSQHGNSTLSNWSTCKQMHIVFITIANIFLQTIFQFLFQPYLRN